MNVKIISFTKNGDLLNKKISELFENSQVFGKSENMNKWNGMNEDIFNSDILIFVGAVGIAVRLISPFIKSKDKDPAVVVCDEKGQFVIPLLSGHIGGANKIGKKIADFVRATCVITTATDLNNIFAVDVWATENNFIIDDISMIKHISGALLENKKVGLVSDFEVTGRLPENVEYGNNSKNGIVISLDKRKKDFNNTINLMPKCLWLGVGSRKNADEESLIELFEKICEENGFDKRCVKGVVTIDLKKDEKSVLKLCDYIGCELEIFMAQDLNNAEGEFESSEFVKSVTGTDNVCERSASLKGDIIVSKTIGDKVTMAVSAERIAVNFENGGNGI